MTKRSGKLNAHATHTGCSADLSHDHKGAEFLGPSTQNEAQTRAREANDISCHLFIDFFFSPVVGHVVPSTSALESGLIKTAPSTIKADSCSHLKDRTV